MDCVAFARSCAARLQRAVSTYQISFSCYLELFIVCFTPYSLSTVYGSELFDVVAVCVWGGRGTVSVLWWYNAKYSYNIKSYTLRQLGLSWMFTTRSFPYL